MLTRILLALAALILLFGVVWTVIWPKTAPLPGDAAAAQAVAEAFGRALKDVSLLAPEPDVARAMQEHYGRLVAPELIAAWSQDPERAPGRLTSSPWPERIEIASTTAETPLRYRFSGDMIEVTSEGGGIGEAASIADRRPIMLTVEKRDTSWLIASVVLGALPSGAAWGYAAPDAQGVRFMYPIALGTSYISTSTEGWPPTIGYAATTFACDPVQRITVGDSTLCASRESEGAAGSTYITFRYAAALGSGVASTTFTLRYPQCLNFDEPQRSACTHEEATYDVDGLADRILSSIGPLR